MKLDSNFVSEMIGVFIKSFWQMFFKLWYIWVIALMIGFIQVFFKILDDLLDRKSRIRWFLSKKKIQDVQRLSPIQFEKYVGELFRALGFRIRVIGGPGDEGIDVEAVKDGIIHYIQCKQYTRPVPVSEVRDFYGAIVDKIDSGKALGAKRIDINRQFLFEAIILTLLGGIIGISLGSLVSFAISYSGLIQTKISILSVLLAFGISAAIGIVFGYYPAKRASALNPIEALRYE